jgi:hypothetical protein
VQHSTQGPYDVPNRGSASSHAPRQLSGDLSQTHTTVIIHEGMPILGLSPSPMILYFVFFTFSDLSFSFPCGSSSMSLALSLSVIRPPEDQTEILSKKDEDQPVSPAAPLE